MELEVLRIFRIPLLRMFATMTTQQAYQQLFSQLQSIYDHREADNIADLVMEKLTGWKKMDRTLHKESTMSESQLGDLKEFSSELMNNKPVQYVLHESWFCGFKFYVDENVLIPRPETEELVEWVIKDYKEGEKSRQGQERGPEIVDIGTGSGCIAVSIKKNIPGASVFAMDVDDNALGVARRNANEIGANVQFIKCNILDRKDWALVDKFDLIVSNPPYIPVREKETMTRNVLDHEPWLALFVENEQPLLFYEAIADFAREKLNPGGYIYLEINETEGESVPKLFRCKGFSETILRKDMQGWDRLVRVRY